MRNSRPARPEDAASEPGKWEQFTQERSSVNPSIEIPTISLPKGGGAIKGIDEQFQVNPANGTASFQVPLPLTSGRNGFTPGLSLDYQSGGGNGSFGLGWSLNFPHIRRKTDKKLPSYQEGEDIFSLSGSEDLVPFLDEKNGDWTSRVLEFNNLIIRQYRPRIEGAFSRVECIQGDGILPYWKVTSRENISTYFGYSENSRIADPEDAGRTFSWLPEFSHDDKGNWIRYRYKEEDLANVAEDLHEYNRFQENSPFTNRYLKSVQYGNRTPWYSDDPYQPTFPAGEAAFFFELILDYGAHNTSQPTSLEENLWLSRPDAFSSYRSGFDIRTYRLCRRILLFHHFEELGTTPCMVRSLNFEYTPSSINESGITEVSYLNSIRQYGYLRREDNSYSSRSLPPLTFEYQELQWQHEVRKVSQESLAQAPIGLTEGHSWVDLYGEGLPGILTEQATGLYYKENQGDPETFGQPLFTRAKEVAPRPSFIGFQNGVLSLEDLGVDGQKQLVVRQEGVQGFYSLSPENQYEPFQVFARQVNLNPTDPNLRRLDLDGDGKAELVITEERALVWYPSEGKEGYGKAHRRFREWNENRGPDFTFADTNRQEAIMLADMSGDGLTDIVRIRNGEVCYWPNLGYGKFGTKVNMSHAPQFDLPDQFNPTYLQLADVSGTGTADLIYVGKQAFHAYLNLSGNAWSEAEVIEPFFPIHDRTSVQVLDLLGTGTACIVWSSSAPADQQNPMRFIDLMGSRKPHLLIRYANNLGKETRLAYRSSTYDYLRDKQAGTPWITKLPFPVQVIARTTVEEHISQVRFSTEYRYHHGYYDHAEREFRGFGMVEQTDTEFYQEWTANQTDTQLDTSEALYQAPVLTRTWFHTGAYFDRERMLDQFEKEYWYEVYNSLFPQTPLSVSEPQLPDAQVLPAQHLIDQTLIDRLSAEEWREALRACKGMMLRQEVFALDGEEGDLDSLIRQAKPYGVATHNCLVQLLQPRAGNRHAVFQPIKSEAISLSYERNEADPRISHTLNLQVNEWGQVLESASVVYGRQQVNPDLPLEIRLKQAQSHIIYSQNQYTNDYIQPTVYRLRSAFEAKSYEITGLQPTGMLFQREDFDQILTSGSNEVPYQQTASTGIERRLIEQARTLYYEEELTGPLPLGQLPSHGISFESYQLAYTPTLLTDLFGGLIADQATLMTEGRYLEMEGNWWVRSGTTQFIAAGEGVLEARSRFFSPLSYTDPFGSITTVGYYLDYFLLLESTTDAIGNQGVIETFDFRTLSPLRLRDANNNLSEVVLDELGLVKALAVLGKGTEADNLLGISPITEQVERDQIQQYFTLEDSTQLTTIAQQLLQNASQRFVYDFDRYMASAELRAGQLAPTPCEQVPYLPSVMGSIIREQHATTTPNSRLQLGFSYTDGSGNVIMAKTQAEPGEAQRLSVQPNCTFTVETIDTGASLRWIGNGRTILNNKGNPVKQFEPYFSISPFFENARELVEKGVTPILYYDALGRSIRSDLPDGTFSRTEFDSWQQRSYDPNDTVRDSQWYADRGSPDPADPTVNAQSTSPEVLAAWKAAQHHDTPSQVHLDSLGRPIYSLAHNRVNGGDEYYATQVDLDIEGNARAIIDARGNVVMRYAYNLLGQRVSQQSMDAGERWTLNNVMGNPLRSWDGRGHVFSHTYDVLQRPLEVRVQGGDGPQPLNHVYQRIVYGENQPNDRVLNLRGQAVNLYDTAGKVQNLVFDFKGNLLESQRQFALEYKQIPNWSGPNPDVGLEAEAFSSQATFDALNRPVATTHPDGSIHMPTYNEAGLLASVSVNMSLPAGNGRVDETFVQHISYDEKGRRSSILYGNNVRTRYTYDPITFRLTRLESRRQNGELLQDLSYTYDPAGNITEIQDGAIPTVFFGNFQVQARARYTYDALYRLIEAEGREHIGQNTFGPEDNWRDSPFFRQYQAGDPMAFRPYTQSYQYDGVGNILRMQHQAQGGNWTRTYTYEADNNRLQRTQIGRQVYTYPHHAQHGYLTAMPHLSLMQWNFQDELQATACQVATTGAPETTWYVYDGQGQRVRKITENVGGNSQKEERLYLGSLEIYRKHSGQNTGLERQTLHISDDSGRIAMIDTRNAVDDNTERRTIRYQMGNHLGSVALETNETGEIISYEEYHPYGTTAYQAVNANIRTAAKRYRYTGMERDEETGLSYHAARYYVPWLGRWTAADPAGLVDGVNVYGYVGGRPIILIDPSGNNSSFLKEIDAAIENAVSGTYRRIQFRMNIDEIDAVHGDRAGGIAGSPSDPHNKQILDSQTNSVSKGNRVGPQPLVKPPVSVNQSPLEAAKRFIIGRLDEIDEVREHAWEAAKNVKPGAKTNTSLWRRMRNDPELKNALSQMGIDLETGTLINPENVEQFPREQLTDTPPPQKEPSTASKKPTNSPDSVPNLKNTKTPKLKGAGLIGRLLSVGIAGIVYIHTEDAYAAGQVLNPAANTTDAIVNEKSSEEIALSIGKDLYEELIPILPIATDSPYSGEAWQNNGLGQGPAAGTEGLPELISGQVEPDLARVVPKLIPPTLILATWIFYLATAF